MPAENTNRQLTLGEVVAIACETAERITPVPEVAAELASYLVRRTLRRSSHNEELARRIARVSEAAVGEPA